MKPIHKKAILQRALLLRKIAKKCRYTNKTYVLLNLFDKKIKEFRPTRCLYTKKNIWKYDKAYQLLNLPIEKLGNKYRSLAIELSSLKGMSIKRFVMREAVSKLDK